MSTNQPENVPPEMAETGPSDTTTIATVPPESIAQNAEDIVRQAIAEGKTVLCAIMVPVGAVCVIMDRSNHISAYEIEVGETTERPPSEILSRIGAALHERL